MKKIIALVLVGLLVVMVIPVIAEEVEKEEYTFRKTTWGMSKEKVQGTETGKITYNEEDGIFYEGKIVGLDCWICYIFAERKLVRAKYFIIEEHSNKNDYISDYDNLKKALTKKYGEPISDKHLWKDDLYKDDPQEWGFAISLGDLVYWAEWETLQTEIRLILWGDNYDIKLEIEYRSKELGELEEKEKEKKLLEEL